MDPANDPISNLLTAIHSNNVEEVETILRQGANINDLTDNGGTILHLAVKHKDTRCLPLLLQHGADPNFTNDYGDAPLHIAAECGNTDAVRLLIQYGADVEETDMSGNTALERASDGNKATIRELLKAGAELNGTTVLYYAARSGKEDFLIEILQHCESTGVSPNVNECIRDRTTPLDMAAARGFKNAMQLLLKLGADPNIGDSCFFQPNHSLPIHSATQSGDIECVKMLLPPVTDLDILNKCKLCPFYRSMKIDEDRGVEMCKLLVQAGVQVNTLYNLEHSRDYRSAVCYGVLFDYLKVFEGGIYGTALCELTLLEEPRLEIARVLLDAGARIDPIRKNELPTLVAALQMVEDDVILPQLLVERGADVNIYHDRFVGNLAVLCTRDNFTALEFILNAGAEVDSLFEYVNYDDDDDENIIYLPAPLSNLDNNSNNGNIDHDVDDDNDDDDVNEDDDDDNGDVNDDDDGSTTERISMFNMLAGICQKKVIGEIVLKLLEYSVKAEWNTDLDECLDPYDENKEKIIDIMESPRTLQHLCRAAVRRTISPKHLISPNSLYSLLPLPPAIIDYVLHKPVGS